MGDLPSQKPGKNRIPKMADRTETWLLALLKETSKTNIPTFAPILPIPKENQRMYFATLQESAGELAGLVLYDSDMVVDLPEELAALPRLAMDEAANPHQLLRSIGLGVDMFTLVFLTSATDAGISLGFEFPGAVVEGAKKPLGVDMWNVAELATDTGPLADGCTCYSCRRHHRAYVVHLLQAKEMTAWVLLQIHNTHVMDRFFEAVRLSIARGTFEEDSKTFAEAYEDEMPAKTGAGPR